MAMAARAHRVGAARINLNLKMRMSRTHNANSYSSMVKASRDINILAVLPLASNASSAVSAAMIMPAIMARTESKYFRIVIFCQEQIELRRVRTRNDLEGSVHSPGSCRCLGIFDFSPE
jgi:hypothetical protein